jgi:hypothetical protein
MSSGIRAACNVESTVDGTSDDGLSPVMVSGEAYEARMSGTSGAYMRFCNGQRPW